MQFILMNYTRPSEHATAAAVAEAAEGALWGAYTRSLVEAGVLVGGEALHPAPTATTLRLEGGRAVVRDGPFADTAEQLGGFYVIEVPDLDTALGWAARNPAAAGGAVEVRPVVTRG
ncbi:YciI family protein [Roseicyclus persicicus]|uniref:YCII-related domain-containing protein n=1 Tax=Roseicyclus persicicus TaxID=2650661 RepID=A0A7X6JY15_9RHOB|nr:YciI family protein [Roseibacterium persicicum]NKX43348.1 hypothetical protein [Roseibacterium persicicum]